MAAICIVFPLTSLESFFYTWCKDTLHKIEHDQTTYIKESYMKLMILTGFKTHFNFLFSKMKRISPNK